MPTTIKLRNSVTTTNAPSSLAQGEVAINVTDKKVWVGNAATTPVQLLGTGADGSFTNLAYTGTLTGGTGVVNLGSGQFVKDASGNFGFGVSPNWDTYTSVLQVPAGGIGSYVPNLDLTITQNAYYAGGWKYSRTGLSNRFTSQNGEFIFSNAVTGTSGNAITWLERMRIDSAGNVGIGTSSPSARLDISINNTNVGNGSSLQLEQVGTGDAAISFLIGATTEWLAGVDNSDSDKFKINNITGGGDFNNVGMTIDIAGNVGIGTTTPTFGTGGGIQVKNSSVANLRVSAGSSTGFDFSQSTAGDSYIWNRDNSYIAIATNNTERMRIDSSGNLLVGATSLSGAERLNATKSVAASEIVRFLATHASDPYGQAIIYPNANPNSTANEFFGCYSLGSVKRMTVQSNGGIANFSANNVNLSDAREKTNIELAGSYLDKICAIPVKTFNYIDQNRDADDGLTLGVIAQDVQAIAPELVVESDWGTKETPKMRLSIYQTDLQYALMKAIQEQQALIQNLTTRLNALEGK